jgi:pimeloyl-ACP methyl ester carboxylesterase
MELCSVPLGRGRLHYWRRPSTGPAVLLLHGLGADHAGLLPIAAHWPDADVYVPDLPGHGRSAPLRRHTLPAYADLIDAFCDRLGLLGAHVVGHSLGATIALTLAARHPARVRSAVLLNPVTTATGPDAWAAHAYYRLGALLPRRLARQWFLGSAAVKMSARAMVRSTDPEVRRRIIEADLRTAAAVSHRAVVDVYHSIRRAPFAALARRVSAPVLIVGAEHDRLTPRPVLESLRDEFPHGDLVIVPGGGHLWAVEEPAAAAILCAPTPHARPAVPEAAARRRPAPARPNPGRSTPKPQAVTA